MKDVLGLLELQREAERRFVAEAATEPDFPRGWSAGLLMAHVAGWRGRLRDCFIEVSRALPVSGPPADIDAVNDAELARNAGISLDEAASRAELLLADLIDLWATIGERPFSWFTAKTTSEALVRNSFIHPRRHLAEHYAERGDQLRGVELHEETLAELHRVDAPQSVIDLWK
jgi:hypothetical protein